MMKNEMYFPVVAKQHKPSTLSFRSTSMESSPSISSMAKTSFAIGNKTSSWPKPFMGDRHCPRHPKHDNTLTKPTVSSTKELHDKVEQRESKNTIINSFNSNCNRSIPTSSMMMPTWITPPIGDTTTTTNSPPKIPKKAPFPLMEKNTTKIIKGIPIEIISSRILNFLRINSIPYTVTNFPSRMDCFTESLLKFTIQLWQEDPTSDCSKFTVILHVSRRQGCSIEMSRMRHRIYRAATTGKESTLDAPHENHRRFTCQDKHNDSGKDLSSQYLESIEICKNLLLSFFMDQNRLGLESLCALTDKHKVTESVTKQVSTDLVFVKRSLPDSSEVLPTLSDALLPFFLQTDLPWKETNIKPNSYMDDSHKSTYDQGHEFGAMHLLALRALSNALEYVDTNTISYSHLQMDLASVFWTTALNAIVYNVQVATHRPLEAALSAKCLSHIFHLLLRNEELEATRTLPIDSASSSSRRSSNNMESLKSAVSPLTDAMKDVHEYGKSCNFRLEQESKNLMSILPTILSSTGP